MKKKIFLVDGFGALISVILLLLLPQFQSIFGIPEMITLILLPLPILFSIFSFLSYKLGNRNWKVLLKIIAVANLFYCCLILFVILAYYSTFKILGITYFIVEVLIIFILAIIELRIVKNQSN